MKKFLAQLHKQTATLPHRLATAAQRLKAPLNGAPPRASWKYMIWSGLTGMLAIYSIIKITELSGRPLLIGSFAASAVLLFAANESPLAQPRNLVGGHVLSAIVAVVLVKLFGINIWTLSGAVGLSIFVMHLTGTTHPPGGATALIGVQGAAGPMFILIPVLAGVAILLALALFTNNIVYHRRYPKHWL